MLESSGKSSYEENSNSIFWQENDQTRMHQMKITYDKDVDALYIELSNNKAVESEEIENDIVLDYDENDNVVGIEILNCIKNHKDLILPAIKKIDKVVNLDVT